MSINDRQTLERLKGFWWFEPGRIAGMARPGYNGCAWSELSFEEGLLFSWFGKQTSDHRPLAELFAYLDDFGRLVAPYYAFDEGELARRSARLRDRAILEAEVASMQRKSQIIDAFEIRVEGGGPLAWHQPNLAAVHDELEQVRRAGFSVIVSLLEGGLEYDASSSGLALHRFPIDDADAPRIEQVEQLVDVLERAERNRERVIVHCLAGIGRTATMLSAAAVLRGATLAETLALIRRARPNYQLRGRQAEFLEGLRSPGSCDRRATPGRG